MLVQCCVCKKVREAGRWKESSDIDIGDRDFSHGYCPPCAAQVFAEIRNRHKDEIVARQATPVIR